MTFRSSSTSSRQVIWENKIISRSTKSNTSITKMLKLLKNFWRLMLAFNLGSVPVLQPSLNVSSLWLSNMPAFSVFCPMSLVSSVIIQECVYHILSREHSSDRYLSDSRLFWNYSVRRQLALAVLQIIWLFPYSYLWYLFTRLSVAIWLCTTNCGLLFYIGV